MCVCVRVCVCVCVCMCVFCNNNKSVRRDNCALVKEVVSQCLNKILIERDVEGAVAYPLFTIIIIML